MEKHIGYIDTKTNSKFSDLDAENKDAAVNQMFYFKSRYSWPSGAIWRDEDDLREDLKQGYNPDEHFSFYLDEFDCVETKIG